ncbi:MAG: iron-sulfur cluster assembly scaffold protein [Alphaproteobacteria bacterium]
MNAVSEVNDSPKLEELYNSRILQFAGNISRIGRLAVPDVTATAHSRLCGSTVTVDIVLEGEMITDFAHEVRACALGQASSSIMAQQIVGSTINELLAVREEMLRMLKHGGPPPGGRFSDLAVLQPVRDYRARHASTILTFDAVADAIASLGGADRDRQKSAELA